MDLDINNRNEPYQISGDGSGKGMTATEARRILHLIENRAQPELNGLAVTYRLATRQTDAAQVVTRLRNLAEGVLQQEHRMQA